MKAGLLAEHAHRGPPADVDSVALSVSAGSAQPLERVTLFLSLVIPARGVSRST